MSLRSASCYSANLKIFPDSVKCFCRIYLRRALRLSPFLETDSLRVETQIDSSSKGSRPLAVAH